MPRILGRGVIGRMKSIRGDIPFVLCTGISTRRWKTGRPSRRGSQRQQQAHPRPLSSPSAVRRADRKAPERLNPPPGSAFSRAAPFPAPAPPRACAPPFRHGRASSWTRPLPHGFLRQHCNPCNGKVRRRDQGDADDPNARTRPAGDGQGSATGMKATIFLFHSGPITPSSSSTQRYLPQSGRTEGFSRGHGG
jgi:hypothetical protein